MFNRSALGEHLGNEAPILVLYFASISEGVFSVNSGVFEVEV